MKNLYKAGIALVVLILHFNWSVAKPAPSPLECSGDITLNSQASVDAFPITYGCMAITGSLTISGNDITNLDSLHSLTSVGGSLLIKNNPNLTSVSGLSSLNYIGYNGATSFAGFQITVNPKLTNLDGLTALTKIQGGLQILDNKLLNNIEGLASLNSVGAVEPAFNSVIIQANPALTSLGGLRSITLVPGILRISNNASLTSLNGLESLSTINGYNADLYITDNGLLGNLNGLSSLTKVQGRGALVSIVNNTALRNVDGLSALTSISGAPGGGSLEIKNNQSLVNINGLSSLTDLSLFARLTVTDNAQLASCCGLYPVLSTWSYNGNQSITFADNGPACTKEGILAGAQCSQVCQGDITLTTQADVDSFSSVHGCVEIAGTLTITGSDITNLDGLHGVKRVLGNVWISSNPNLVSVAGLSSLSYVGTGSGPYPGLHITYNTQLTNLNGLDSLKKIEGLLDLTSNKSLTNVDGLSFLTSIGGPFPSGRSLTIDSNPVLSNLNGLRSVRLVTGHLIINNNDALPDLHGFDSLKSVGGLNGASLQITGNASLTSLGGLSSIKSVSGRNGFVTIADNPLLANLNGLSSLSAISGTPVASMNIVNNASLQDVDGLSHFTSVGPQGYLTVKDNLQLNRGCGLYPLLSASPTHVPVIDFANNGPGFTKEAILAGGPCVQPCAGSQSPLDKFVFAEYEKGSAPHSTNVIVRDYQPGVVYELRKESDNSLVAGPYAGNVGLYVQNLTQTTTFYVVARKPDTGCEKTMATRPVITITSPPDSVDCNTITIADKDVAAEQDSLAQGEATNIIVFNGDSGVEYLLRNNTDDSAVAGPYPSSIGLYSGALYTTTTFNVLATDQATQCSRELSELVTVTIYDPAAPAQRVAETDQQFSISPNPSSGKIDLEIANDIDGSYYLSIRDYSGNIVKSETLNKAGIFKSKLDLNIPRGIYLLSFSRPDGQITSKRLVITD